MFKPTRMVLRSPCNTSGWSVDFVDIRKSVTQYDPLSDAEMKLYHKMTGKVNWLAQSSHLDLSYLALVMS